MSPTTSLLSLPLLGRASLPLLSICPSGYRRQQWHSPPCLLPSLVEAEQTWLSQVLPKCPVPDNPGAVCLSCSSFPMSSLHWGALNWTQHPRCDLTTAEWTGKKSLSYIPGVFIKPGTQPSNIIVQLCVTPPSGNVLVLLVQVSWEQGRDRSQMNSLPCRTWCWSLLGNVSKLPIRSHHEIMKCCLQKSSLNLVYNERQRLTNAVPADRTTESRDQQGTNTGPHFTLFQTKSILQSLTLSTAHGHSLQTSCVWLCWRMLMLITIQSTQTRESLIKNIWQAMIMFIHNCQDAYTCYARSSYCK